MKQTILRKSFPFVCRVTAASFLLVAVLLIGPHISHAAVDCESETDIMTNGTLVARIRADFQLPQLPTFEEFKQMFNKKYNSLVELLVHKRIFFAKSIGAALSAVQYKYNLSPSRRGINHMSDYTPEQVAQLWNKVEGSEQTISASHLNGHYVELDETNIAQYTEVMAGDSLGDSSIRSEETRTTATSGKRTKRDTSQQQQLESVKRRELLNEATNEWSAPAGDELHADRIFSDLRAKSNCFLMPRGQGDCGCCYAFAFISMLEWFYCKATKERLAFSEQYVIDCGAKLTPGQGPKGCEGANFDQVAHFVHNFGVERRDSYAYRQHEEECPYEPSDDFKSAGHIRMDFGQTLIVPTRLWPTILPFGPLYTAVLVASERFLDYQQGVDLNLGCEKGEAHAMVVVGHGREDGRQYWIMRNSFTVGWGEQGYYRMAKTATHCIRDARGYTFGTRNGKFFHLKPKLNTKNDGSKVRDHFQTRYHIKRRAKKWAQ